MEVRDLVSVSRPNFASLGLEGFRSRLGLKGYRSRDFEYCNKLIQCSKISIIQQPLYLQVRNYKTGRKNVRNLKKIQLRSDDDLFYKTIGKMHKFWNPESRSRDFWWNLGLEVLTRSGSRRWRSRLYHWSSYFCILELMLLNAVIVA